MNLASFGADWQNRYEDNYRTIVEYRSATTDPETDPALKTVEFQKLTPPRPQCELFGVEYRGGFYKYTGNQPQSYTVTQSAATDDWFSGTSLLPGTVLPSLVGYEWDTIMPGCNVPPSPSTSQQGVIETATTGTWSNSPASFAYQWEDCNSLGEGCLSISGATSSSYTPVSGDVGSTLRVVVTASNAGGSGTATSAASNKVMPEPPGAPREPPGEIPSQAAPSETNDQVILQTAPSLSLPAPTTKSMRLQQILALRLRPSRFRATRVGAVVTRHNPAPMGTMVTYSDASAGTYTPLAAADAVIVCVPTPLTENREPDLAPLLGACRALSRTLQSGQLVVLQSTTYPGTTRERSTCAVSPVRWA